MGKEEDKAVAQHVSGQANKPMSSPAHALTFQEVEKELSADSQNGLSHDEAKKRLEEFGRNEFGANKGVQPARILIAQIANSLTLVRQFFPTFPPRNRLFCVFHSPTQQGDWRPNGASQRNGLIWTATKCPPMPVTC